MELSAALYCVSQKTPNVYGLCYWLDTVQIHMQSTLYRVLSPGNSMLCNHMKTVCYE